MDNKKLLSEPDRNSVVGTPAEERKGQDMIDSTPAKPERVPQNATEQPPVVMQDIDD